LAPNIEYRRDSDGFALPLTPVSTKPYLYRADAEDDLQVSGYGPSVASSDISGASSGLSRKSLTKDPYYRDNNLAENNIYSRSFYKEFLVDIAGLINHICKDRDLLGLLPDQVKQNIHLECPGMGTGEPDVKRYFYAHVFPDPELMNIL
jgi:hypothetical protein